MPSQYGPESSQALPSGVATAKFCARTDRSIAVPKKTTSRKAAEAGFEKSLAELETLVERMEGGEQNLEEALKDFERGIALTRQCQQALQAAELKVSKLLEENGEERLAPLDNDED